MYIITQDTQLAGKKGSRRKENSGKEKKAIILIISNSNYN